MAGTQFVVRMQALYQQRLHALWWVAVLAILLAGICIRAYNPGHYSYGFDQVQIAVNARNILSGDLTLIGPRTGPAPMFTGPLIYYIAAFWAVWTATSAQAVVWTAVSISALTGSVLFLSFWKYGSRTSGGVAAVLWSFSPFLMSLDRIAWNPNLSVLAAALVFVPLLKKTALRVPDIALIALGVFLGYQAHFSGLLLFPAALIGVGLRSGFSRRVLWQFGILAAAQAATLAPTVLFDARNQWLNVRGLQQLIANKDQVAGFMAFERLPHKLYIVVESLGKMLFDGASPALIIASGLALLVGYSAVYRKKLWGLKNTEWMPLAAMASVAIIYSLYRESTPEYYFLILVPVYFFILIRLLIKLPRIALYAVLGVFSIYGCLDAADRLSTSRGFPLGIQLKAAEFVSTYASSNPVAEVVVDIEPIESLGIRDLLAENPPMLLPHGSVLHIMYPMAAGDRVTHRLSNEAGILIDSRTDSSGN
jgi:hypothetical protein